MSRLYQIQEDVRVRVEEIAAVHGSWPCRRGCDDCCRSLAMPPRVTLEEWRLMAAAVDSLPNQIAELVRSRIQQSASASRPFVCPLLDIVSGTCLIYDARPIACRAYGFYAERAEVLGCHRIESVAEAAPEVVWGNQAGLEDRMRSLGPDADLCVWLGSGNPVHPGR